jgi:pimeloyl-ACP methyl ester carboxylesterase
VSDVPEAANGQEKPTVVLLHGLLRTGRSMAGLERALQRAGYATWTGRYASQRQSIEEAAADVAESLAQGFGDRPLALVTHSLGGILARYIAGPFGARLGLRITGVVMLAPPNAGSRLARRLSQGETVGAAVRRIYGPAIRQLGGAEALWPLPSVPVGIIAGTRAGGLNPVAWLSRATGLIGAHEPSDGTVLVEETHLPGMPEGMVELATVPATHTFIMDHADTHEMVLRFLEIGRLRR